MDDTITAFTRLLFKDEMVQRLANLAYGHLIAGKQDALRLLSGYLVQRGCTVIIKGHEVRARSAGSRAAFPPQVIFNLHGGETAYGGVAQMVATSVNCKVYYLDKTGSEDLHEMEHRYVDEGGTVTPYRSVEEGDLLRD